ncbi:hypothetical protein V1264_024525 [Littorina saxatilis]|uniref:Uncharacterized protein n=1 Tax=Littorina saxatilis TaxID=31220 RepID=A0AAN9AM93_9CAEN
MGNVLYSSNTCTNTITRPDGTVQVIHAHEIFKDGKLKRGDYEARQVNKVSGESQHWHWTSKIQSPAGSSEPQPSDTVSPPARPIVSDKPAANADSECSDASQTKSVLTQSLRHMTMVEK